MEARITINGHPLTDAQSIAVRVAVTSMHGNRQHLAELGAIGALYDARLSEVLRLLLEGNPRATTAAPLAPLAEDEGRRAVAALPRRDVAPRPAVAPVSTADVVAAYYRGNVPWIAERTILLTKAGSHAYGTNTPDSDLDVRGIVVAPRSHYLGLPPPRKQKPFEQVAVGGKAGKEDDEDEPPDLVIYEARKFLALATECNPNIIEVLWTDPSDFLAITPLGQRLIDARETFLSRRAYPRFSRYAMSQMRRMKGHHAWLTNPPKEPPTRKSMGLPERTLIPKDQLAAAQSAVEKKLARWKLNDMSELSPDARIAVQETLVELVSEMGLTADARWNAAARAVGYNENFIELLDLERQYQSKQTHWREYQGWLRHRNPVRAALEAKYGFDTKHGLHLMRLLRMCREILTLGRVIVKRPDFRDLLDVRDGLWSCEALCDWAMREDAELEILAHTSLLPAEPDRDVINQICIDIIAAAISA